jgi:hypothetical protein
MQLVFNAVSSCIKALFSQNALQLVRLPLCNLVRCMVGSWELPCSHLHPKRALDSPCSTINQTQQA